MFRNILSEQWALLSPSVQQHYGLKEGEEISMQGKLTVKHGKFIKLLMPLIRLTGALVPVEGEGFNVTVTNRRAGDSFYWHRKFEKAGKVYIFNSRMQQVNSDLVEFVGLGIGIKMGLKVNNNRLHYEDKGYVFKAGKYLIPVPFHLLMGKAEIEEYKSAENAHDINMRFVVNHPLFGFAFSYMGYFNLP